MGWRESGVAMMNIVTKLSPECGHTRGAVLLSIEITKLLNYSFLFQLHHSGLVSIY